MRPIRFNTHSRNSGFTLIELIAVIAILGFLAVTALTKFMSYKDAAEITQLRHNAAALQQSVNTIKLLFNVQGHTTRVQNLENFGDGTIDTNNAGYPIGIDKGTGNENIGRGANGCVGVWDGIFASAPSVAANNNNSDFRSYRHTGNKVCSYAYRRNGDTGNRNNALLVIKYDSRDGSVSVCGRHPGLPNC